MRTPLPLTGPELRRYRRSRGMSMKELARRTGWSKTYLSLIENNHRPLTNAVRQSCLTALGADLSLDDPTEAAMDALADSEMDHPSISPSVRPCCGRPWEEDCDCEEPS